MENQLTEDDLSVLNTLREWERGKAQEPPDLPPRLFAYGLIVRSTSGAPVVTKAGERQLFQKDCFATLSALSAGTNYSPESGVMKWLISSGFVCVKGQRRTPEITKHGNTWLASFDEE